MGCMEHGYILDGMTGFVMTKINVSTYMYKLLYWLSWFTLSIFVPPKKLFKFVYGGF